MTKEEREREFYLLRKLIDLGLRLSGKTTRTEP